MRHAGHFRSIDWKRMRWWCCWALLEWFAVHGFTQSIRRCGSVRKTCALKFYDQDCYVKIVQPKRRNVPLRSQIQGPSLVATANCGVGYISGFRTLDNTMTSTCYPGRVKCRGRGLTFGYFGQPIVSTIDTRMAGRGKTIGVKSLLFILFYSTLLFNDNLCSVVA